MDVTPSAEEFAALANGDHPLVATAIIGDLAAFDLDRCILADGMRAPAGGLAAGLGGVLVLVLLVGLGFSRLVDVGRWVLERLHLADRLERLLDRIAHRDHRRAHAQALPHDGRLVAGEGGHRLDSEFVEHDS